MTKFHYRPASTDDPKPSAPLVPGEETLPCPACGTPQPFEAVSHLDCLGTLFERDVCAVCETPIRSRIADALW